MLDDQNLDEPHDSFMARIRSMSSATYMPAGAVVDQAKSIGASRAGSISQQVLRERKRGVAQRHSAGMSDAEIAADMGISEAEVVRNRIGRGT